jgi:predicted alpha/beta-fold hydrolase
MARSPGAWLKEGDVVEISIPPLGVLRTPVASSNVPPFHVDPVRTHTLIGKFPSGDAHRMLIGSPPKALHVEVSGPEDGTPVLFFHGLCSSLQSYTGAVELAGLAQTHRVILFDLEGHGQSPLSPQAHKGLSIEQFADDAKAILDVLGMQTAHVVGHSLGGVSLLCSGQSLKILTYALH